LKADLTQELVGGPCLPYHFEERDDAGKGGDLRACTEGRLDIEARIGCEDLQLTSRGRACEDKTSTHLSWSWGLSLPSGGKNGKASRQRKETSLIAGEWAGAETKKNAAEVPESSL